MNILFLRGFNNYFNRVIKKYSTLADYQSESTASVNFESINFNPNDGVATELVLGNESQKENNLPLDWENIGTPDYCICYEMVNSNPVIRSRWFVLESERLRSGQYRLALKRDVVAEHFAIIKTSPCFIEKGMINDTENSLLYNKESMTYNQIKTDEIPLMDSTKCGWIVGYVPKNYPKGDEAGYSNTITTVISLDGTPTNYLDYEELPFNVSTTGTLEYMNLDPDMDIYTYIPVASCSKYQVYSSRFYTPGQHWISLKYKRGSSVNITQYPLGQEYGTYSGFSGWRWKGSYTETTSDLSVLQALTTTTGSTTHGVNQTLSGSLYTSMKYANWSSNASSQDVYAYTNQFLGEGFTGNSIVELIAKTSLNNKNTSNFIDTMISQVSGYPNTNDDLMSYDGMIIKYSDDKFYTISVSKSENLYVQPVGNVNVTTNSNYPDASIRTTVSNTAAISTAFGNFMNQFTIMTSYTKLNNTSHYATLLPLRQYKVSLVPLYISGTEIHTENRTYLNRGITFDSNADIFAIPYGDIYYGEKQGSGQFSTYKAYQTSATVGLAIGRAIAERFSDSCYDLQLVPYCPSRIYREHADDTIMTIFDPQTHHPQFVFKGVVLNEILNARSYQYIYDSSDNKIGFVLWVSSSKDSFNIPINLNPSFAGDAGNLSEPLKYKLSNETQICRVASPNFNGQFEFSLAKNHGITKFNVDYTYKPYSPYIHVNPDFNINYLYGKDWDDARGLICGGDFSLAHITSYWQTYMNNNKNFSQIFDRQIQNMDVNNAIALEKQEFQATVGTITSAVGGALGGAAAGATAGSAAGPWGALIGGVVGAVGGGVGSGLASAYGAEKDRDWLTRQQQEARSFAIDMYGYQLGNIQAMPYSIKGTDALTNNNKIFPILEIYNATENEINILKSKIQYNGMTIMAVGNIQEYSNSSDFDKVFIKGQLIRLESDEINDDFHIADAIYQEINKGVYIPSGGL